MSKKNDSFEKLAQKMYLSYHQDGLIDIIIGACFIGFGINMLADSAVFTILGWMPIVFFIPLKRAVTFPRLGYVSFDGQRSRQRLLILAGVGTLVLGLFVMILFVLGPNGVTPSVRQFLSQYIILILGLIAAFVLMLGGFLSGIKRFFWYAILAIVIFAAAQLLNLPEYTQILVFGALLLMSGLVMLVKFMRKYPISRE